MKYVYILRSIKNPDKIYIGSTKDPQLRLKRHNWGECIFTARDRPWRIVLLEKFFNDEEAVAREKQLKGWSRAKKEALSDGDFFEVKKLARRRGR